jgi:hypothetical protein
MLNFVFKLFMDGNFILSSEYPCNIVVAKTKMREYKSVLLMSFNTK